MKQVFFLLIGILLLNSCSEKDISVNSDGSADKKAGTDFSFQTTQNNRLNIYAVNANGSYAAGIPVLIYIENPYTEEGTRKNGISPIAFGVTDKNGKWDAQINKLPYNSQLYILTDYAGFGGMQICNADSNNDIILQGTADNTRLKTKLPAKNEEKESYNGILVNRAMNLYTYWESSDMDKNGILSNSHPLIEYETLSAEFLNLVNAWYPEKKNVQDEKFLTDPQFCTDMEVKDENGCEIWVTYIGDGGFSNANPQIKNMLAYYQYNKNHSSLNQPSDSKDLHKTLIFHNTNAKEARTGCKVQLLYWDGEKYVKAFPKGTHIGWCLIQAGYNKNSYNTSALSNVDYYRFSTLELSTVGKVKTTQGIARWNQTYNCNIVGMENREKDHRAYDGDYNDVLFRVTSNPIIKPDAVIPPVDDDSKDETCETGVHGTLAFEDMWPHKQDWDHNDLVADYSYLFTQNATTAQISAITVDVNIRAIGAARTNGFGIELPVNTSNIHSIEGATLETGTDKATVIIYEDTREAFNGLTGIINTYSHMPSHLSTGVKRVKVYLKHPVSNISFSQFNPFIFVGIRTNEIHLADYKPTDKAQVRFGTNDDATDGINTFYKTNNNHTWGLDIPRLNAEAPGWKYPEENISIEIAYPKYEDWAGNDGKINHTWYENPLETYIYHPKEQ